nr:hypothetical protein RSP673_09050 [Ralstonia solanacearum P673]
MHAALLHGLIGDRQFARSAPQSAWALAAVGVAPVFAAWLTSEAGLLLVTPASFCGVS